jgi:hypothetical protein
MLYYAKYEDVSSPDVFRPIALTNCDGKLFFSLLAADTELFMLKNDFISMCIQKGFLTGIAGCLEHTFALQETLRQAITLYRQIIVVWIDLANAYGSVMHNPIQFALWWYHVPEHIAQILFNYYEQLCARFFAFSTRNLVNCRW